MNETPKKDMSNVSYDPSWPKNFEEIKAILENKISGLVLAIEHVGSTAIPGLSAKPRLDIDIIIDSTEKLPSIISQLEKFGYYSQRSLAQEGREVLGRKDDTVPHDGKGTM